MTEPVLAVRGLSKRFGALQVAQAIDLELTPGARRGLIGPNGAGKTSFVNLLTGMLQADRGAILLAGRDITHEKPERRVHLGLARTHQINTLLSEFNLRDNVAVAIAERDHVAWRLIRYTDIWRRCREEADSQLAALGIGELADRTVAGLAYGQQRLLEIAIALALKPRVLLLDEPAAGVPTVEAHAIHDVLDRLPPEIAILMIEHDMDLVFRFAREITVLVQGRVLITDTPKRIAADPDVRAVYLGRGTV
ncbi:MAG: ABC transporter ATP-binding protein [Stellaceae bacterium]